MKYGNKHPSVQQLNDNIAEMKKGLDGKPLSNLAALGTASVKIIEQAQLPLLPTGTSKKITFALAIVMGPFLGIMLAFVFEYMNQTFISPNDIERHLQVPNLGSISKKAFGIRTSLIDEKKTRGAFSRSFQILAEQIFLLMQDGGLQTIMITSVLPKEGVTTTIANIGAFLAKRLKYRVLIIDANLRTPAQHKMFKLEKKSKNKKRGLADLLEGKASFKDIAHTITDNLTVLPAGLKLRRSFMSNWLLWDFPRKVCEGISKKI